MGRLSEEIPMCLHKDSSIIIVFHLFSIIQRWFDHFYLSGLLANRNYGQINGTSPRVSWSFVQVIFGKKFFFIDKWVIQWFSLTDILFFHPFHEMIDSFLRTVGIIDHELVSKLFQLFLNHWKTYSCLFWDDNFFCLVSFNGRSYEVIFGGITDWLNNARIYVGEVIKAFGKVTSCGGIWVNQLVPSSSVSIELRYERLNYIEPKAIEILQMTSKSKYVSGKGSAMRV